MADYLKLPEVARRLDVSEKTARRMVKSGGLPAVFIGGAYRISEEALAEYLENAKVEPGKAEAPPSPEQPSFNGLLEEERRPELSWEAAGSHAKLGARLAEVWGPELEEREAAQDLQWFMRIGKILVDYEVVLRELFQNVTFPDEKTAKEAGFLAADLNAFFAKVQEALPRVKEEAQRTKETTGEKASR